MLDVERVVNKEKPPLRADAVGISAQRRVVIMSCGRQKKEIETLHSFLRQ